MTVTRQALDLDAIRRRSDMCAQLPWHTPDGRAAVEAIAADVPDLLDEVDRLRAERATVLRLVRDLADEDDCWFDHHGGCQAHGYLSLEPGEKCPHQEAKELVAANEEEELA